MESWFSRKDVGSGVAISVYSAKICFDVDDFIMFRSLKSGSFIVIKHKVIFAEVSYINAHFLNLERI